jgi:hypothetical protein
MDMTNVLNRIKKCLALAASANEHEAAAALRQAQKLMAAYNVTEASLIAADIGSASVNATVCTQPPAWELRLVNIICEAFGCQASITKGWFNQTTNSNGALARFTYFGAKPRVETAIYAHALVKRQLLKAKEAHLKSWAENHPWTTGRKAKLDAGDTFANAFVVAVSSKVEALMLDPAEAAAVDELFRKSVNTDKPAAEGHKRGFDHASHYAGAEAGQKASVHRGIGASTAAGSIQ